MENEPIYKGKVTYVDFDKQFATIEYLRANKQKSITCKLYAEGNSKKPHQFRLGDVVTFLIKLTDRGDRETAYEVKYLHNEGVDLLIQKANIENRFNGYLKKVDDKYFVKEWDSYILFPLQLSPWEKPPVSTAENQAVTFILVNIDKPNAIVAELFSHNYTPAYKKAEQHFKNKINSKAIITRLSPHAVYVTLFDGEIMAKLKLTDASLQVGNEINVIIAHLSPYKIVIEKAD
jgi:ribosomal protein S1